VWSGKLSLDEADTLTATDGTEFATARSRVSDRVDGFVDPGQFSAFIEAHIEQGPVLDAAGEAVGVVTGIVGLRQFSVTITGQQNHAGTTPMAQRTDAFAAAARVSAMLPERFANIVTPQSVWTIGHIRLHPNASSIVPGRADFTLQWRDIDADRLDRMEAAVVALLDDVASETGCDVTAKRLRQDLAPVPMDERLQAVLSQAAARVAPGRWRSMPSGALHDASNLSRVMPVAMLFVPSINGISHDFAKTPPTMIWRQGSASCATPLPTCAEGSVPGQSACGERLAEGHTAFPKLAHPPDQRDHPVDRSFDIHAAITDVGQAIARAVRCADARGAWVM
jgi:N-carbamoyl-L-amino-acid hydrolase